jgi:UDP-N-acetylmuramate dehydrogenase
MEWAAQIPGTVGGAAAGNAGAFGGSMSDIVKSVTVARTDGFAELTAAQCAFSYRSSAFATDGAGAYTSAVITAVTLALKAGGRADIAARAERYARIRRDKQPAGLSAGSAFKAAGNIPAGLLIDRAGLKGTRAGGAHISDKHTNFIINGGGAHFRDVKGLMDTIAAAVYAKYGIKLESEIKIIE